MFVKDKMTPDPITVTPEIPVIEAQQKMQRYDIRHLPVVDAQHHIVGLLTRETMLQAVPWSQAALSTLAAALAESGKFPEAVQAQEEAIKLVKRPGPIPQKVLAPYTRHLQAYQNNKPWRE